MDQTIAQLTAQVGQLQEQQALTYRAVRSFLEGRLDGPDSATWLLSAISPGVSITPAPFVFDE